MIPQNSYGIFLASSLEQVEKMQMKNIKDVSGSIYSKAGNKVEASEGMSDKPINIL